MFVSEIGKIRLRLVSPIAPMQPRLMQTTHRLHLDLHTFPIIQTHTVFLFANLKQANSTLSPEQLHPKRSTAFGLQRHQLNHGSRRSVHQ
jgi:hypothetical protein